MRLETFQRDRLIYFYLVLRINGPAQEKYKWLMTLLSIGQEDTLRRGYEAPILSERADNASYEGGVLETW